MQERKGGGGRGGGVKEIYVDYNIIGFSLYECGTASTSTVNTTNINLDETTVDDFFMFYNKEITEYAADVI